MLGLAAACGAVLALGGSPVRAEDGAAPSPDVAQSPDAAASPDAATAAAAAESAVASTTYRVRHGLTVKELPAGARRVRVWFWMPEDTPDQRVRDLRIVRAPPGVRVTRDLDFGRSWIVAEWDAGEGAALVEPPALETEFLLERREARRLPDPRTVGPLTEEHRRVFAQHLRTDEAHMEVTPEMRRLADELCGEERNVVRQARRIYDFVLAKSDHYSLFGPTPKGKCLGDAQECLTGEGDCCTDQHALFLALARARGIPTRLHFGSRLLPRNEGKDLDPGYRCWISFFAPGHGWVPLDCSAGDTDPERRDFWFGGLDDQRVEFAEGRGVRLVPAPEGPAPDLVIRGWVEVDGRPHGRFDRVLRHDRVR